MGKGVEDDGGNGGVDVVYDVVGVVIVVTGDVVAVVAMVEEGRSELEELVEVELLEGEELEVSGGTLDEVGVSGGAVDEVEVSGGALDEVDVSGGTPEEVDVSGGALDEVDVSGGALDEVDASGGTLEETSELLDETSLAVIELSAGAVAVLAPAVDPGEDTPASDEPGSESVGRGTLRLSPTLISNATAPGRGARRAGGSAP